MEKITNYIAFDDVDFAGDASFQEWVLRPTEINKKFWLRFVDDNPGKKPAVDNAVKLLKSVQFKEEFPTDEKVENFFQKALVQINLDKSPVRVIPMNRWWAAASILLLLSVGTYFFTTKKSEKDIPSIAQTKLNNEIAPGGNKATLTLSDGSNIILDSVQNGLLSNQGNAQVSKTDNGKLVYENKTGEVVAVQYNTISTPRGGQYQLTLADGSQVWLNAESSITFPTSFSGNQRQVKITGEAYFEIAHDADKPFHVNVNEMDVKVIGTHFNVNAYKDEAEIKTTLLEGSVQVTYNEQAKIISPRQQLILNNKSGKMVVEKNINIDEIMAWKNGKFYFNEANIQLIMKQVSRWYNVDVEYKGEVNKLFEGTISRQVSVEDIFKILSATGGVHFAIEGRKIIVSP